eukprot:CAMPEP_0170188854 /NCGR_PEP_ID=MMETSP0040_2-20121228/45378_1 /TAXON_ID=641309 /ORGANISM="Lotharella oceanica, Strain CCMP622" /LENGTH=106 /DNA_ID=CAMNT_0010436257 /DNA_START=142 /DNA_END=459 /DNA_ORIENTATION=+
MHRSSSAKSVPVLVEFDLETELRLDRLSDTLLQHVLEATCLAAEKGVQPLPDLGGVVDTRDEEQLGPEHHLSVGLFPWNGTHFPSGHVLCFILGDSLRLHPGIRVV